MTSNAPVEALFDGEPRVITVHSSTQIEVWACQWFAGCTDEATRLVAHPILSPVPACDRHGNGRISK